ncbi:DUF2513 domain-containing protein [Rhodopirellula sp. MGV]|uniref:DUF2513 domain-containing protein n=1 Tax=Rhodopirellula sp. MGV TaxID=2023130 RepID=UPI000B973540|nr:DUF2513 domain-containing protein [Rhodopirellula sp. MGV]OYP31676.1 hypothetical protein CGZ80_20930 [Rhodopirellula sp. MGV]PNY33960.1 DUF2513 domain-containing protein [Rhodopirellula baltica]
MPITKTTWQTLFTLPILPPVKKRHSFYFFVWFRFMKRDMYLVRKLLEFIETKGSRLFKGSIPIEGYERDSVVTHVFLCADAGFIELGEETLTNKGPLVLTWKGCDYLDDIRAKGLYATPGARP